MPFYSQWLSAVIIVLMLPVAYAGTLYRWVDAYGVVHISDRRPPPDGTPSGIQAFPYPENEPGTGPKDAEIQEAASYESQNDRDSEKIKTARMAYEAARIKAADAQAKAEQLQLEADQYSQKWGAVSRTRRGVRSNMALKTEAAEAAAMEAEHLSGLANEAEARLKQLEKK